MGRGASEREYMKNTLQFHENGKGGEMHADEGWVDWDLGDWALSL